MRKIRWIIALAAALAVCLGAFAFAAAEAGGEQAEWTVLFYFCGSDLESKYGYASDNLKEIRNIEYPYDMVSTLDRITEEENVNLDDIRMPLRNIPKVNILIETGGSREWHAQESGMDISADALQRWEYIYYPENPDVLPSDLNKFELRETLPLRSMADPETLADFIRWGAQAYPAKKYALVLWGHGYGAKTGLFVDELFDGDIMYLYELREALAEGGAHMEAVVIDACLMANLETAWNIREYANWMVASEEEVPGSGTAMNAWMQSLINFPRHDGEWLGRCVCEMTSKKYADRPEEKDRLLLTWSVIDLSAIDRLTEAFGGIIRLIGESITERPIITWTYTSSISRAEEYGDGSLNMHDLGDLIYDHELVLFAEMGMLNDLIDAFTDAVKYNTHGYGRSNARGLSFCYPADFSDGELNLYAKNFPNARYLALLDAITTWKAPEWVYEKAERIPEIDSLEEFRLSAEKKFTDRGMPALDFRNGEPYLETICYNLYRLDADTGEIVRLGRTSCGSEFHADETIVWRARDPMHWPAIEGQLCCIDLIQTTMKTRLYSIPVQINADNAILRCGRTVLNDGEFEDLKQQSEYRIYGVWEGYDANSELPGRSVEPLAMVAGRKFRLLYPKDGTEEAGKPDYAMSDELTMLRAMDIEEIPLPPGTYYIEYEVEDIFMRTARFGKIEIRWDGEKMTFPHADEWTGTAPLTFLPR